MNYLIVSIIVAMGILTIVVLLGIYNAPEERLIKVINTNFSLKYTITGGKVLGSHADLQDKRLIISIETTGDGKLTVTIPRALVDAKIHDNLDDSFFVLADGEEVFPFVETKTMKDRTLIIPIENGNQEIEIIGSAPL